MQLSNSLEEKQKLLTGLKLCAGICFTTLFLKCLAKTAIYSKGNDL